MGITKTTLRRLPDAERAEVEAILREFAQQPRQFTDRFCSDEGDTLAWFLLLGLAGLGGVVAAIVEDVPASLFAGLRAGYVFPTLRNPLVFGFVAAAVATVWSATTFVRTHRRCGWAVTTFGVLRVFGAKVKLLRFVDVASAERRQVNVRRPFSVLELRAKDGGLLTTYATPLMGAILARVST